MAARRLRAACAVCAVLAGCGTSDRLPGLEGQRVECGTQYFIYGGRVDGVPTLKPAPFNRVLDSQVLVGLTVTKAESIARAHGCLLRVVQRNGRPQIITDDERLDRIDVATQSGIVVKVGVF
jgi:hypothetical protein